MSKFNNKKTIVKLEDGTELKFDSRRESEYYFVYKGMEQEGLIFQLDLQYPILELQPSFTNNKGKRVRAINYRPDFSFIDKDDNKLHIIDVKGNKATQTPEFKLKWKMAQYIYPEFVFDIVC